MSPDDTKTDLPASVTAVDAPSAGLSADNATKDTEPLDSHPPVHPQLSPLSVQAASLVRSIDALSNIFWLCFFAFFLSIFFAGLSQLEANTYTDYLFLGEYQVPKAILPLACLSFAVFAFWLVSNRLNMLGYVLGTSSLSYTMVREIFHLNPPVLHVFDKENANQWSPFTGVSVFIFIWSVFFGNAISLIVSGTITKGIALGEFDPILLSVYALALVGVLIFGVMTIAPPLRNILHRLHGEDFRIGWPRQVMAVVIACITVAVNQSDQLFAMSGGATGLVGPAYANAIDGETLYVNGMEVVLVGIDAVESDQICQSSTGEDYPCGQAATQALQAMVQTEKVICLPIVNVNERRILALCELALAGTELPTDPEHFIRGYRPNSLARLMVENGHAVGIGIGLEVFKDEQRQAQTLRTGIWQGSFMPPRLWRTSR